MKTAIFPAYEIEKNQINRLLHACVREQLLPHALHEDMLIIPLKKNQKLLLANHVKTYLLGKVHIGGDVILVSDHESIRLKSVKHLLDLLKKEFEGVVNQEQWQQFMEEIGNSVTNEALSQPYLHRFNHELTVEMLKTKTKRLTDYIGLLPLHLRLAFFERWAAKGHPYHPCHKTKLGFSRQAYLQYSPEFHQDIFLPMLAIAKSICHVESEEDMDYLNWFTTHYPEQANAWQQQIQQAGLPVDDYYPLFVHPWQYKNVLTKLFSDLFEKKQLVFFSDITITTKASLSFRTMIVKDNDKSPHIKLPVAIRSTSAMRTISPASVENGPKISRVLREILSSKPEINHHIKLAYESCSLHVKNYQSDVAKHLAIIYRQNPVTLVQSNEMPIVLAALFEPSPLSGLPLFIEMIYETSGVTLEAAKSFFNSYCERVIKAYLDLFLIYGIALEGHQQNTIAVFLKNEINYFIARDLGGLRLHVDTLKDKGYSMVAYPNSATITDDRQEVVNKFLHSVIQYHLGELILLLSRHYQASEKEFWQIVKQQLMARFNNLKDQVHPTRWQQEFAAIFEQDWQIKGLMRMRLNDVYSNYIYLNLKNPLRDC